MKNKLKKPKRRKVFFILTLSFLGLALVLLLFDLCVVMMSAGKIISAEEAAGFDADCILILGAGVREDGSPTYILLDRLDAGIELYNLAVSGKILVSGDHGRENYDEVNAMKDYAVSKGISSQDVFMDHAGFSTYESMYRAREVFNAKKIVIVTQEYHLYRAIYIANALGLDAVGVKADRYIYSGEAWRQAREHMARIKDFVKCIFKPLPAVLGEAIPVSGNGDITNDK